MQYAYFIWSLILLGVWIIVYFSLKDKISRKEMLVVSLWTSFLGLTESLFVPEYWSPPTLFDLARRTGFDIESLLFAFGVGGLAVIIYERIFKVRHKKVSLFERHDPKHRLHLLALFSTPIIFVLLLVFTDLNPIYSTFIALSGGGLFAWYCRPDLKKKMITSAFIFLVIYFFFFLSLVIIFPNYVKEIWNLSAISGILISGIPLEELMFALGIGFLWSSFYEHLKWYKIA
jgi:hypothetical protein